MRIFNIVGARPNFIKIAPILRALQQVPGFEPFLIHTGQHYDRAMSHLFFEQLGIPEPDHSLNVGSGTHARQTAEIMIRLEKLMLEDRPDLVIVVGDVNSTLAAALTAAKLGIRIVHVEAGLRSFDMSMPEEINRLLVDRISEFLFVSEPSGMENLQNEGLRETQHAVLVGNVMIDSLAACLPAIEAKNAAARLGLSGKKYAAVTVHRPSNVDTEEALLQVLSVLEETCEVFHVVLPIHPRTRANLERFGLLSRIMALPRFHMTQPLGYFEFLNLVSHASCVLTDSGGLQEETTWLGIPCITLRENTERPITISEGTNVLTGLSIDKIRRALQTAQAFDRTDYEAPKLWDGKAARRIMQFLVEHHKDICSSGSR